MQKIARISLLMLVGLFGSVVGKEPAVNLDELAAQAQAKPDDPKIHYELALAYARLDSGTLAVAEYKTLLQVHAPGADDPYLRTKIASFLDLDPYPLSQVSSDTEADRTPCFAGRSDKLLFESNKDGPWQIYRTNIKGDSVERITNDTIISGQPTAAANGSMIAYAIVNQNGWKLALLKQGEKTPKVFNDIPGLCRSPSFSPDGREIAFQWQKTKDKVFQVALLNIKTGKVRLLTDNMYFNGRPKFSPNGKSIIYHCNNENLNFDIYMMDRNGKNPHAIGANPATEYDPCFWDSDKIVFSSNRDGNYEIYVMNLKNNDILRLTSSKKGEEREPTVSSDGHWLAFRSDRTGKYKIFVFDLTKPIGREELAKKLTEE